MKKSLIALALVAAASMAMAHAPPGGSIENTVNIGYTSKSASSIAIAGVTVTKMGAGGTLAITILNFGNDATDLALIGGGSGDIKRDLNPLPVFMPIANGGGSICITTAANQTAPPARFTT